MSLTLQSEPRPGLQIARDQTLVMARLSRRLTPTAVLNWLETPQRLLSYRRPSDLIAAGRTKEVLSVLDAMERTVR